jgi:hypothetical protein
MAERGEFELPVPISEQSDYRMMSGFAAPRRIIGIARGSKGASRSLGELFRNYQLVPAVRIQFSPSSKGAFGYEKLGPAALFHSSRQ